MNLMSRRTVIILAAVAVLVLLGIVVAVVTLYLTSPDVIARIVSHISAALGFR